VADGDRFGHGYDHVNGHDLLRLSRDCGAHFPAAAGWCRESFVSDKWTWMDEVPS